MEHSQRTLLLWALHLAATLSATPVEDERGQQEGQMARATSAEYDAVAEELVATSPTVPSSMFGMPCLKTGGKAFAGFTEGAMVFKLGAPEHAEALALAGAHLFDPMGGRPMKEWVVVPAEHADQWLTLARAAFRYLERAH
jgi:hypothetical protein